MSNFNEIRYGAVIEFLMLDNVNLRYLYVYLFRVY